ncbi:hypothetical protein OSB04_018075 [Centaurea solstitialis]|uniref:DUF4005 domain-containing protein n=1 Tax=Centaurea solstitialis TaxID=347529 RepID=A0AA38WIZ4_9ASTR|nr:hypothetical protein OSB04_018075 [Centaurea solstitialis]
MGRSTTSCFRIISSCGGSGQSQDKDDIIHVSNSTQNKSPDKRGWSFRKRSVRHRVLSNTVITETPASETKETQIPSSVNKESSVTEIPEKKESFVTELPSSGNKESSVTELPTSENESSKPVTISTETIVDSSKADNSIDNQWTEETAPRLSNSITKDSTVLTMTNEAACEDDVKRESVVSESATTEAAREDGVKDESGLNESATNEAAREDDVKYESGLSESATTEASRQDDVKCESGLNESAMTEAAREDDVKHEPSLIKSATTEAAREDDVKHESDLNESATTEAACEDDVKCESSLDESAILVIQAAVRRFLAQKQLNREKNVVKLQAAVRGHLVRNHAVGTLRCVQAIIKMQTLVRARHAERLADGDTVKKHPTYVSTEKLLSNKLARQLLESTPKTKQINIKCDPSKSDSAWSWLGRWMAASTPETVESHAPEQDQDEVKTAENEVETVAIHCESTDVKSDVGKASVQEDSIDIKQDSDVRTREEEEPQPANLNTSDSIEKPDLPADEPMHLNTGVEIEVGSVSEKPVSETEPKRAAKRFATDQADSEGRKSVFGSRKASNPAFIAAQSRFEELTSKSNPLKSVDSFNQDDEPRLSEDIIAPENATVTKDVEPEQHSVSHSSPVVPNGGSECGTELSVTSTLDSPDRSEVENKKTEEQPKVSDEPVSIDVEECAYPNINETSSDLLVSEKHNGDDSITENQKPADNVEEKLLDNNTPEADIELEPETNNAPMESEHETVHHAYKSSGEASPKSHTTVPESQGTPSSQVSTNTKKTKTDKKASSQKRKSWSTSKKSTVTSSPESGVRSSLEQLPKDSKSGKRRNSFGSPRPDHVDQEARDSSGNSTVPSYMQATESARAKAIANNSPRSSPDVQQDKEMYMKKRHSLPGAVNGRQGSPRIQRSMSQALQSTKGNGSSEKKWQR